MAQVKFKIEIHGQFDTEDYPIPADGNLTAQIKEDVMDAIESTLAVEINAVKITRSGIKNDAVTDQDI